MAYSSVVESAIKKYAAQFGVDADLIRAIIRQESGGSPNAMGDYDSKGVPHSFGLMQLNDRGAGSGHPKEYLLNIDNNVRIGTQYLKACLNAFPGDLQTGISAYNQGIGGAQNRGWTYNRGYVESVLALYEHEIEEEKEEEEEEEKPGKGEGKGGIPGVPGDRGEITRAALNKITPSDEETKELWKSTFDKIAAGCSLYIIIVLSILATGLYFILR